MKKLLSILFCLTITLFIYSQEVTVSGGHSVQENKTTKVILNAVNGSVEIHKHVLDGTSFGYGSGSAWNDDLGYISTRTTTTVNTSTTEYLCDTPAELTVDKPVKLSIGGNEDLSFTINPTGGTQYWDVRAGNTGKYICSLLLTIPAAFGLVWGTVVPFMFEEPYTIWNGAALLGGIGCTAGGIILCEQASSKVTLIKVEY